MRMVGPVFAMSRDDYCQPSLTIERRLLNYHAEDNATSLPAGWLLFIKFDDATQQHLIIINLSPRIASLPKSSSPSLPALT